MAEENNKELVIPPKFETLFTPNSDPEYDELGRLVSAGHKRKRYYVRFGGRASWKSHTMATAVVLRMAAGKEFVVCCREVWKSMAESVHRVLCSKIDELGLRPWFVITDNEIKCPSTGSLAIFKGLGTHVKENIKSIEGSTICWVEEADDVSEYSWSILIPTVVRTPKSEIWVSMNVGLESDATYQRFVVNVDPERMDVVKVNVMDMPQHLVPEGILEEMEADKLRDYEQYLNTWEGFPLIAKDGGVFKPEMINMVQAAPAGCRWVRAWDFASSALVPGKDPDWTVGLKFGYNPSTERYVIADIIRFRATPDVVEATLIQTAKNDGAEIRIDIPTDPGQAGKHQVAHFVKKLAGFTVDTSPETGDKRTRVGPVSSQINVGNVDMVIAPWNDIAKQEMKGFNGDGKRKDDIEDALARAFTAVSKENKMVKIRVF